MAQPSEHAHRNGSVSGHGHGPEPRGDLGHVTAHTRGGGDPGRIPENLAVGGRSVAVSVVHLCSKLELKVRHWREICCSFRQTRLQVERTIL